MLFIGGCREACIQTDALSIEFILRAPASDLSNKKPITAITVLIERLTKEEYDVDDLSDLPTLIESIRLQRSTGPTEAARAIRKKLSVIRMI